MCMAIPMQVLHCDGIAASCRDRDGSEVVVDCLMTGPLEAGQWVLIFLGSAREVVDADEAARISSAIDALDAMQAGELLAGSAVDAFFPDLAGREPQLPPHLEAQRQAQRKEVN